mgnify:CR=1 FL=1
MVRIKTRDYTKDDVLTVFKEIHRQEPVNINTIVFELGPNINEQINSAVDTLFEEDVIGSKEAFLKTHINFSPWDTIIYDGIAESYIGVDEDKLLYLKDKSMEEFTL